MVNIKQLDDWFDTPQLVCTKNDGKTKYNLSNFTFLSKFASKIYNKNLTPQEAEDNEQKLEILINNLNNNYDPKNKIKTKKEDTLKSTRKLFFIREEIIWAFKRGIFSYIDGFKVEKESNEKSEEEIDTTDIPDLESEESTAERRKQNASGLTLVTPNQILSRLPITLAQLNAGNNSEKLKNEIRQLLYSLYRSKKLTKQFYKSLVDNI